MNEKLSDCCVFEDENFLREECELLLLENANLRKRISTYAAIIDCIADDLQGFLNRDDLAGIIRTQAETISDLKKYVAKKIQDDSSADIVYKLTSKNALLTAALLNSIDVNAKLREQLIKVLDTVENKNIIL